MGTVVALWRQTVKRSVNELRAWISRSSICSLLVSYS